MHLVLAEYRLVWLRVLVLRLAREHPLLLVLPSPLPLVLRLAREHPLLLGLLGLPLPLEPVLRLVRALPLDHRQKSTR
jgi:hypothetical protein